MSVVKRQIDERRDSRRGTDRNQRRAAADIEFVNYELDKEQAAALVAWRQDVEAVDEALTELIEGGYKVSIKYDDYSSSCAAFAFPGEGSDNGGYCLTGRGGTGYRAICSMLFKHAVVSRGIWADLITHRTGDRDADF